MKTIPRSPLHWVTSLYFAMGLPFVVLNMVSAVLFKDLGVTDARIAFWTSLIMWPWTIKFLWSPFLEFYRTKKFWVVATQFLSGVLFGLAALSLHLPSFFAVTVALFAAVAFSGATHDIAADGVYMAELSTEDQAKYIGWQGAFYNLAKLVATGGLVWLAGWLYESFSAEGTATFGAYVRSWTAVLVILCGALVALGAYHLRALPSGGGAAERRSLREGLSGLKEVIAAFFTKRHIWYYIAFIILYRLGEGFVMKIVPLFLKADASAGGLGLTNQQIGLYYGTFGAGAFLLGSMLAGYYIARRGLRRTLFALCCVFNLPFAVYALLAWFQPSSMWLVADLRHARIVAVDPLPDLGVGARQAEVGLVDVPPQAVGREADVQAHAAVRVVAAENAGVVVPAFWERHDGRIENTVRGRQGVAADDRVLRVTPQDLFRTRRALLPRHIGQRLARNFQCIHITCRLVCRHR